MTFTELLRFTDALRQPDAPCQSATIYAGTLPAHSIINGDRKPAWLKGFSTIDISFTVAVYRQKIVLSTGAGDGAIFGASTVSIALSIDSNLTLPLQDTKAPHYTTYFDHAFDSDSACFSTSSIAASSPTGGYFHFFSVRRTGIAAWRGRFRASANPPWCCYAASR